MKTISKAITVAVLSGFMVGAFADDATAGMGLTNITPNSCGVSSASDQVAIIYSKVPGRAFISCNARIVKQNPEFAKIQSAGGGLQNTPVANPWVVNPDGHKSFICKGSLSSCEMTYLK